ncbi:MAG: hypothetical protein H7A23_12180 [Leptospiraceae bacterium]|nr:hypothetical protein [Leptospiraceae bacterium]
MNREEITIQTGTHIWKSPMEYFSEHAVFHGSPYYQITEVDDVYYLWELSKEEPEKHKYQILKTSDNFGALHDEGMELNNTISKK